MQSQFTLVALRERLCSVVAVPVAPFDDSGAVDETAFRRHNQWLTASGLEVICANGNTSEFYSLSLAEHVRLTALAAEVSGGALMMTGIGLDVETALAAGRATQAAGLSAVMVHALAERCPNFVGVKYAVPDPVRLAAMIARWEVFEREGHIH